MLDMEFINGILRFMALMGVGFSSLLAIGQLIVPDKRLRNYAFIFIYLCIATIEFSNWNADLEMRYIFPRLSYLDIPLLYCIGPLLYIIYQESINPDKKQSYWVHFVIPPLIFVLALNYYVLPATEKINRPYDVFILKKVFFNDYLYPGGTLIAMFYVAYITKEMSLIWKDQNLRSEPGTKVTTIMLLISALTIGLAILCMATRVYLFFRISAALLAISMGMILVAGYRYPEISQSFIKIVQAVSNKQSYIAALDLEVIKGKLEALMRDEKIYHEPDLTLGKLAALAGLSVHQLSEFINTHFNINFSGYVNQFRVEEAKKLLIQNPEQNILQIAYQVGFNSTSAFHRYFAKFAYLSPKAYRKKFARTAGRAI